MATVPRTGICARLARLAAPVISQHGSDFDRINDLAKTVQKWQQETVLKCASAPHSASHARGDVDAKKNARGWKTHYGTATLAGRAGAADCDQTSEGRRRLGCVTGLVSSTLRRLRHPFQWAPKFTKELGRAAPEKRCALPCGSLRAFNAPLGELPPGMAGLEDCEGLFTRHRNKKTLAEKYPARLFSGIQKVDDVDWAMSIGYRVRRTQQMASPRCGAIWYHYYAYFDRVHFVLQHFRRCEGGPPKKMGAGDAFVFFHLFRSVCYTPDITLRTRVC